MGPFPTLADIAEDQIARRIIIGQLAPGERLVETRLALVLGLSRGPVREALRRLSQEGLVTLASRRGAVVARLEPEALQDLYEARAVLEEASARLAAANISEGSIAALRKLISRMKETVRQDDSRRYLTLNLQFHRIVWEATPNKTICEFIRLLWRRSLRYRYTSVRIRGRLEESFRLHQELLSALSSRNAAAAGRASRRVVEAGLSALRLLKSGALATLPDMPADVYDRSNRDARLEQPVPTTVRSTQR